ncbi:helix-turn-helix transcriptional regulator [Leminorella grimontii]|uniref:helix-turn-helix domain-containing protein n=1 Tax=Leminorella grimontii TaxID=82981 RepID=UPI00322043E1
MAILKVNLRDVMEKYQSQTGMKMTYDVLATKTGISKSTLESIATREDYNTRLSTILKLCEFFNCQPGELLELKQVAED